MAFITHLGAQYDEDNFGSIDLGSLRVVTFTRCNLAFQVEVPVYDLPVNVTTECSMDFTTTVFLTLVCESTTEASLATFVIRTVPSTAKISAYTISPAYADHLTLANNNLISQFRSCPNILSLIGCSMTELDQAQDDIYNFQSQILNIEEAEGVNLDICGAILGRNRLTGTADRVYRNQLITQVAINTGDGTLPSILKSLCYMANLEPNNTTMPEMQVQRLPFNSFQVYFRDVSVVDVYGSTEAIKALIPAGASVMILVNDRYTTPGNYFSMGSYYEDDIEEEYSSLGSGFGSIYNDEVGGQMVGIYNVEDFVDVPGETTGTDLLTTTKTIPVATF